MSTVGPSLNFGVLPCVVLAIVISADGASAADEPQDHQDRITNFNIVTGAPVVRSAWPYPVRPPEATTGERTPRSVGLTLSPNVGIGAGESVALTYDDAQYTVGQGRHIAHSWNGDWGQNTQVDVHFGYVNMQEVAPGQYWPWSGYNLYTASEPGGDWPRCQDVGCELQASDTLGWGGMPSLDVLGNGLAVMAANSVLWLTRADGTRLIDSKIYYQWNRFGCIYLVDPLIGNVTWVDSTVYRQHFLDQSWGYYSRDPQVVTQWDGSNTIVHLLLGEDSPGASLTGPDYCDVIPYFTFTYFRKVGDDASGTWSEGQIIDSLWFPWVSMAAQPNGSHVAVTYTNPTPYACQMEHPYDLDVWLRESSNYGLAWGAAQNITNYRNDLEGHPDHFTAWLETQPLYSADDDLHVIWTAKPTSENPYLDGYDWESLDQNLYHWSKNTNEIVKVANGAFPYVYSQTGVATLAEGACGFGGSNAGYIANINISECDGKLFCIWNQIHERSNRYPWRDVSPQPAAEVLDDCAYTDEPMARANWEIMMSVAQISSSSLWDYPRNITNTYTPSCGLPEDPEKPGDLCGSEYKPSVERYAFDEAGLDLYWPPAAIVDPTPEGEPAYFGTFYLNMEYLDDQFPGPSMWGEWQTLPRTLNSIKWIRLACVEPIEAAEIAVTPTKIDWPRWVKIGQSTSFTITVLNEGNVALNVSQIGTYGGSWLSVSENPTPPAPFEVPAGVANTCTFDVWIDAGGIVQPTWLDGLVWLKSDAANADSLAIPIHVLAADTVEPVFWDTVTTHEDMFNPYISPVGACIALAVGNNGELGWGARCDGRVNLDYTVARTMDFIRRECDTIRDANRFYLISSTPYVILANASDGSGAVLSQVFKDRDQADETGFDPIADKGSMRGGLSADGKYDSVYTGKFVNRDTTIAMERIVYGPRSVYPATDTINFVIVCTKVYSADGVPHNHVTIGNATDFDVPSNIATLNRGGIYDGFVYFRGTDTVGTDHCSSHEGRYATEAFGGGYTSAEWQADNCVNNTYYQGSNGACQAIMTDTSNMRDGTPLDPWQPNPLVWWQTTAVGGLNIDPIPDTGLNLALFTTYKYDYNLSATDTLYYWTVMTTTPIGGTLSDLTAQVAYAKDWYLDVRGNCGYPFNGCYPLGDLDGSGGDEPYPEDMTLIDAALLGQTLYGSGEVLERPWMADIVTDSIIDTLDFAAMVCRTAAGHSSGECRIPEWPGPTTCTPRVRLKGVPLIPIGNATIVETPPESDNYVITGIGAPLKDGVRMYRDDYSYSRTLAYELDGMDLGVHNAAASFTLRGTINQGFTPGPIGSVIVRNGSFLDQFRIDADYSSIGTSLIAVAAYLDGQFMGMDTVPKGIVVKGVDVYGMPEFIRASLRATNPPSVCVDLSIPATITTQSTPQVQWFADCITLTALDPTDTVTGIAPVDMRVANIATFSMRPFDDSQLYQAATGVGSAVSVPLGEIADVVFETVTGAGITQLVVSSEGPQTPTGFQVMSPDAPMFYDLSTTAVFSGVIDICLHYDDTWLTPEEEEDLVLLHYVDGEWVEITQSVLTATDVICGRTTSLSTFVVGLGWAGCCEGRVGDANGEGDYPDEVTLGDIMLMVDVKFITGDCNKLPCLAEADVNQDGGTNPTCEDHITLGDIMYLVDFLFISGPENTTLPDCL